MRPEESFWHTMRDGLKGLIQPSHCTRIENTVGTGVPDVNILSGGRERWVELKVFDTNTFEVRPAQLAWITQHTANGGKVFIVAEHPTWQKVFIYPGALLMELVKARIAKIKGSNRYPGRADVEKIESLSLFSMKKPYNWRLAFAILFNAGGQQ